MASPYTNTKRSTGTMRPGKHKRLRAGLLALTLVVSLAAAYTALKPDPAGKVSAHVEPHPHGSPAELTDPATFMAAYLAVNCGPMLLEGTRTIRISGTVEREHGRQAFHLMKKRPDRMRFTIDRGSHEMTVGVDGDSVWRRLRAPVHSDIVDTLVGPEAAAWKKLSRFFDRIIGAHLGEGRLLGIDRAAWEGRDCLEVRTEDADGARASTFVDLRTLHPLAEQETLPDGRLKQTILSDYRAIDGMPIPFAAETRLDGTLESRVRIESAQLNSGILSELFERPEDPPDF